MVTFRRALYITNHLLLKITDRSFRYASPRLSNQLPNSLRVSLTTFVSIYLLIHLSTHLLLSRSRHPSLLHSFTSGSKPTFSTNPSRSWDRTGLIMLVDLFLVRFFSVIFFLFFPCGGLSWLHVSFLLPVKHTISYRITGATYYPYYPCVDLNSGDMKERSTT